MGFVEQHGGLGEETFQGEETFCVPGFSALVATMQPDGVVWVKVTKKRKISLPSDRYFCPVWLDYGLSRGHLNRQDGAGWGFHPQGCRRLLDLPLFCFLFFGTKQKN